MQEECVAVTWWYRYRYETVLGSALRGVGIWRPTHLADLSRMHSSLFRRSQLWAITCSHSEPTCTPANMYSVQGMCVRKVEVTNHQQSCTRPLTWRLPGIPSASGLHYGLQVCPGSVLGRGRMLDIASTAKQLPCLCMHHDQLPHCHMHVQGQIVMSFIAGEYTIDNFYFSLSIG